MKKIIALFCFIALATTFASAKVRPAEELKFEKIGIGIVLGDPLGISAKLWLNKETAFVGVLSVSTDRAFYLHADYLTHNYVFLKELAKDLKESELVLYYGGGAYLAFWSNGPFGLGARLPVGVEYLANPFDIFVELAPVFSLTPSMGLGLQGGIGVRFNF